LGETYEVKATCQPVIDAHIYSRRHKVAVQPTLALGIENSSSLAWSAPERFQTELADLSRAAQHHLYLVVVGPQLVPTALQPSPDPSGWKLGITFGTPNGPKPRTITVPEIAFPGFTLSFDSAEQVLTLVPASGSGIERKITVAEVVRAAIKVGHMPKSWVDATVDKLFTFEVAYIGQSYGKNGSSKAIDRLTKGHQTVDKIFSDIQSFSHNREVAFITVDQYLTTIDAHMSSGKDGAEARRAILKSIAKHWGGEPLSDTTVDAAEAALITAFKPKWNELLKDFTQKEAPALLKKLKDDEYTHLRIRINLTGSNVKVKGPLRGIPSAFHSWSFNLETGAIELPGTGPMQWDITDY
jgi:hypothetical protein